MYLDILTTDELVLIRESFIKLSTSSINILQRFYSNFFELDSSAQELFEDVEMSKQRLMFFESISYFINNKRITEQEIESYVSLLKTQHQDVQITPSQGENFEKALLITLKEAYGDSFTPQIEQIWKKLLEEIFKRFLGASNQLIE